LVADLSQVMCKDSEPGVIDIISTEPGLGGTVVVVVVVVSATVVVVSAAVVVVSTIASLEEVVVAGEVSAELEQLATKRIKNATVNKRFIF